MELFTGPAPSQPTLRFVLPAIFGVSPEAWLNLQSEYDLRVARRTVGKEIAATVKKREAA
jgi:plasmid maintenance system antidote protein VapI